MIKGLVPSIRSMENSISLSGNRFTMSLGNTSGSSSPWVYYRFPVQPLNLKNKVKTQFFDFFFFWLLLLLILLGGDA